MRAVRGKVIALLAGIAIGAAGTAGAATTANNLPFQTWFYAKQANEKIGNPMVGGPPRTVAGQIDRLQRDVQYLSIKVTALCRTAGTAC